MASFKYSIIRYIDDIVTDEPINIGVMINDVDTNIHDSKIIDDIRIIKKIHKNFNDIPLKFVIDTLRDEHESNDTLAEMSELQHQLQFTKPHALIANNRQEALDELYDTYVTIVKNFTIRKPRSRIIHNITKHIDKTISELKFSTSDYIRGHTFTSKKRQVKLDYTFKNGKITDTIKLIPINIMNQNKTRADAALFATDYRYVKDDYKDVKFHAIIDDNIKNNPSKTDELVEMVVEDLAHVELNVKKSKDVKMCLTEIQKRISR